MITIDLSQIEKKRIEKKMKRAVLARKSGVQPDTLFHFLKSTKKLKDQLNLIDKLCQNVGISWKQVIK